MICVECSKNLKIKKLKINKEIKIILKKYLYNNESLLSDTILSFVSKKDTIYIKNYRNEIFYKNYYYYICGKCLQL